jgi:hypothetical protein
MQQKIVSDNHFMMWYTYTVETRAPGSSRRDDGSNLGSGLFFLCDKENYMFGDEQEMTGEQDGGDVKIGGKRRKKISATGKATKKKSKKRSKKAHKKVVSK